MHANPKPQICRKILECRLQLSRGLILGMDIMVVSDIIETLCGHVDLVKLVVIVAVRSWLGYERAKEMEVRAPHSPPRRISRTSGAKPAASFCGVKSKNCFCPPPAVLYTVSRAS